jgi:hypothetical protein
MQGGAGIGWIVWDSRNRFWRALLSAALRPLVPSQQASTSTWKMWTKIVAKAQGLGATAQGGVIDMFWGDRCGMVVDPDGYAWMVGTHKAEPTTQEMKKKMAEQMRQQSAATAPAA